MTHEYINAMSKKELIEKIKKIVCSSNEGSISTADLQAESSPVYSSTGKDHYELVERFNENNVDVVQYIHETETGEKNVSYEDLDVELLSEILSLLENYEADEEKTIKRCSN